MKAGLNARAIGPLYYHGYKYLLQNLTGLKHLKDLNLAENNIESIGEEKEYNRLMLEFC